MRGFWGVAEKDHRIERSVFVCILRGVRGMGVGEMGILALRRTARACTCT
jgi:hypothetical protein